jgi:hypothetical protein
VTELEQDLENLRVKYPFAFSNAIRRENPSPMPIPTEISVQEEPQTVPPLNPNSIPERLPYDSEARKETPITTGVVDYFPNALAAIARISKYGNDKHNPGKPMHWARAKSADHADCVLRHLIDRGKVDKDGLSHTAMAAWRILALLELEEEEKLGLPPARGSIVDSK